jgi:hypothetical protein
MVEKVEYAGQPNNYRVSTGNLEAIITADFGPRVVRFGFVDGPNELGELPHLSLTTPFGEWRIRGGHRLWHSPEASPRSYYPDNDPLEVKIEGDSVRVTEPVEPPTGIRKTMCLVPGDRCIDVEHTLTNTGLWPVELAPWAITIMAKGGTAIAQQAIDRDPANLLPNRLLRLWPYTDLRDPRIVLGTNLVQLHHDASATGPTKIGLNSDSGWAAYYNCKGSDGHLFIKRFVIEPLVVYPDGGCTVESYTNPEFLELESLGPMVLLEPGESTYHVERWYLFGGVSLRLADEDSLLDDITNLLECTTDPD